MCVSWLRLLWHDHGPLLLLDNGHREVTDTASWRSSFCLKTDSSGRKPPAIMYSKRPKPETYCADDNLICAWISVHSSFIILPHCNSSFASCSAFDKFSEASLNLGRAQETSPMALDSGPLVPRHPWLLNFPSPFLSRHLLIWPWKLNISITEGIPRWKD